MPSFWEKLQVNGQETDLYASVPRGSGPFPAVVVAQHGGGVDKFIQTICDRLAEEGYAAVAPNLYHRITDDMLADGSRPVQHLKDPEIVADINAAVDFLRNHSAIDGERIGVTGFCMGGRVTWLAAASNPHIKAAVPYYGGNIFVKWGSPEKTPFELANQINCPILFHFGELDANPSQDDMRKLDAELTRLGKSHQFYTYPGANHAFMDFTGERHHQEAADASWPRTLEFFARHLKGAAVAG
jgi:carboxymethylenebutenolidase